MIGINHFEIFLLTGILLNLTPGNDTIFILSRSIAQGKDSGIISALGIGTGSIIHTSFAAFGLSILISQSIFVFNIIKYMGAVYLVYLGIKMFLEQAKLKFLVKEDKLKINPLKIYRDAVFTNVLNPKVAMFFIAFLPQFIDPVYKNSMLPFLILGLTFTFTGTVWCIILATFSAQIFAKVRSNQKFSSYLNKICGTALIGLGLKLALTNKE